MSHEKYVPSEGEIKKAEDQMTRDQRAASKARERNLTSESDGSGYSRRYKEDIPPLMGDKYYTTEPGYDGEVPVAFLPDKSFIENAEFEGDFVFDPKKKRLYKRIQDYKHGESDGVQVSGEYWEKDEAIEALDKEIEQQKENYERRMAFFKKQLETSLDRINELKHRIENEKDYNSETE